MTLKTLIKSATIALTFAAGDSSAEENWQYAIKPYGWYLFFDGNTGAPGVPPVNGDKSLLDILDGFFLVQGEARRGKLSLLGEFNWVTLSDAYSLGPVSAGWTLEGYMLALAAGYAVYEQDKTRVEVVGGLRFWDVGTKANIGAVSGDGNTTILDPILGLRLATPITDRLSFHAQTSYGIGGDSKKQFDLSAEVRWQWLKSTDIALGYRDLRLDFDKDAVLVDARLYGPYAAINFRF